MSFMGRRSSRSPHGDDGTGSDSGKQREDRQYDDYEHGSPQQGDDSWSPDEYFTPEGIKGRWAADSDRNGRDQGGRRGAHGGGRGSGDSGRGSAGRYDDYGSGDDRDPGAGYANDTSYGDGGCADRGYGDRRYGDDGGNG